MAEEENLAAQALQERQTISDDDVRTVIDRLLSIVKNPKANFRSITAASRVLLQYRKVNLDAIKTAAAIEEGDLVERLEALEERNEQASD